MILQISSSNVRPSAKKLSWKQELKSQMYKRNKQQMKISSQRVANIEEAQSSLLKIFNDQSQKSVTVRDKMQPTTCHSYYSTYIPLKMQNKFDDQLTITFPYIKYLIENARGTDRTLIILEISEFMKSCKAKGEIDIGWQKCLQKYICDIDSIKAAEIYIELKKYGTEKLKELHQKYGGSCLKQVFFERVCNSAKYFKKFIPTNKSPFSVQINEEINEVSMPKTMKYLFCCICMIYDCYQHTLDDSKLLQNQYQYISPKNVRSEQQNLKNAITICLAQRQLLEKGQIKGVEPCSAKCYKHLNCKEWQSLQLNRVKLLSPMVKGVIRLGIQMYSYSPCDIWFLITEEKITCSHVFLFLIEQYNIIGRLRKKLMASEEQMLIREKQNQSSVLPQPPRKGKKKIKIAHSQHNTTITTCFHYFKGEEPSDLNCNNCSCREKGYCLPQCLCSNSCPIRKRGCNCKKQDCRTKKCICFSSNEECDPSLCGNCFEGVKKNNCRNHKIMSGQFKKVRIGRSTISQAGLGLFAGEYINKDELLMIYSGELIDHSIDVLRESLSVDNTFYNFGSPEGTIDARFMGNLSRFINHADLGRENLQSKNITTQGRIKIGFYAIRDIDVGEQLFFDYDGEGQLFKNYKDKYPFIKDKKKK